MGKYLDMLKRLDATAAMNSRRRIHPSRTRVTLAYSRMRVAAGASGFLTLITGEVDDLALGSGIAWLLLNVMAAPGNYKPVMAPRRKVA
jgi:hypothetical protein